MSLRGGVHRARTKDMELNYFSYFVGQKWRQTGRLESVGCGVVEAADYAELMKESSEAVKGEYRPEV